MKNLQDTAAFLFIVAVFVLTAVAVLGVWHFFSTDVIVKSFETLGLLGFVAVVIMIAGHFIEARTDVAELEAPNPIFKSLRESTLGILIGSGSLLALLGVFAIWDVLTDKAVVVKAFTSLMILTFSSLVIALCCLEREHFFIKNANRKVSGGAVLGLLFLAYLFFSLVSHSRY